MYSEHVHFHILTYIKTFKILFFWEKVTNFSNTNNIIPIIPISIYWINILPLSEADVYHCLHHLLFSECVCPWWKLLLWISRSNITELLAPVSPRGSKTRSIKLNWSIYFHRNRNYSFLRQRLNRLRTER